LEAAEAVAVVKRYFEGVQTSLSGFKLDLGERKPSPARVSHAPAGQKRRHHSVEIEAPTLEVVPSSFDRDDLALRRDHRHGRAQLIDRAERIAGTVDEDGWHAQMGKMLRPRLRWLSRRVQGIGEQQQSARHLRRICCEHRGLSSAIGSPAKEYFSGREAPQRVKRVS